MSTPGSLGATSYKSVDDPDMLAEGAILTETQHERRVAVTCSVDNWTLQGRASCEFCPPKLSRPCPSSADERTTLARPTLRADGGDTQTAHDRGGIGAKARDSPHHQTETDCSHVHIDGVQVLDVNGEIDL